jgi:hypothetical protein
MSRAITVEERGAASRRWPSGAAAGVKACGFRAIPGVNECKRLIS